MAELFANSEDPDQMPHSVASDLGLHCFPITLLGLPTTMGSSLVGNTGYLITYFVSRFLTFMFNLS